MVKQTSALIRQLAHNDPTIRKNAFKALTQYLQSPAGGKLKTRDLEKLWKGLYYSMWFCDKPVPQQGLAHDLGTLFSKVVSEKKMVEFHRAFWVIISHEWRSIDKWRLDKYLMLVRRVLRHNLFRLQKGNWASDAVENFLSVLSEYPLSDNVKFPQALAYHICDIYLDEIEYVVLAEFRDYSQENDNESENEEESEDDGNDSEREDDEELEEKLEKVLESEQESATKIPKTTVPVLEPKTDDENAERKKEIIATIPLLKLLSPFEKLAVSAKNKALREKCKEEVLDDERLQDWAVVENKNEESEDEWTGF